MYNLTKTLKCLVSDFPFMIGIFAKKSGKLIWCNESWKNKYRPGQRELYQNCLYKFINDEDLSFLSDSFESILSGSQGLNMSLFRYNYKKTENNWFLGMNCLLDIEDNETPLVCCIHLDLSGLNYSNNLHEYRSFLRKKMPHPGLGLLTRREVEILKLIAAGKRYTEISETLFIAKETVNKHRKNIQHKLRLNSIALLTCFAIENGLIELNSKRNL